MKDLMSKFEVLAIVVFMVVSLLAGCFFVNLALAQNFVYAVEKTRPAVVHISIPYMGGGSGFIVTKDGYILTNAHVANLDGAKNVTLDDGREFVSTVIGTDKFTDIALLKIDCPTDLPFVTFGDSDTVRVGQWVIAIGSPLGLRRTVSAGIISMKDRVNPRAILYTPMLQTDTAINPGNSGGPLVNIHGEVVGINTQIISYTGGSIGLGFCIPINRALSIRDKLLKDGRVLRGWMGLRAFVNGKGVEVVYVLAETPAEVSGLRESDVILSMDGVWLSNVKEFHNMVANMQPGDIIRLYILRGLSTFEVKVVLGDKGDKELI
jgi:serine protease Do